MHSTKPDLDSHNQQHTLVIPVSDIVLACHLAPKFNLLKVGLTLNADSRLLDTSEQFWLNHYYIHYLFQLIEHWRHRKPHPLDRL